MSNLEFIEAKIKSTERRIQELREDQSFAITYNREDEFLDLDSDIEYYEDLLYHLQQIKSELEAWDFTKRELGLKVIERNCGMFGSRYALKCDYEDAIPLLDKEVESFKKALEAKNERRN